MRKRLPPDVLEYFRKEGSRGATLQAANMTPAQRKARATKASKAAAVARTTKRLAKRAATIATVKASATRLMVKHKKAKLAKG